MAIFRAKLACNRFRRRKRIGLWLLAAFIALAVWTPFETQRAARQWRAAQEIKALGGTVRYNYQFNWTGGFEYGAKPYAPAWLRNATNPHFLTRARK